MLQALPGAIFESRLFTCFHKQCLMWFRRSAVVVIAASKSEWHGVPRSATPCPITAEYIWTDEQWFLQAQMNKVLISSEPLFPQLLCWWWCALNLTHVDIGIHTLQALSDVFVLCTFELISGVKPADYPPTIPQNLALTSHGEELTVVMDSCHGYMLQVLNCCVLISL